MSFPAVLERGDAFLGEYPRDARWWGPVSHLTCCAAVAFSKTVLTAFYTPKVIGLDKLEAALERSKRENRGLVTMMNHMSVVDDPFMWGMMPWRMFLDVDTIRWGLAAHNICFSLTAALWFFSLGKILPTVRFGRGPFQGSIDAAVRLLSPDDTLALQYVPPERAWWERAVRWANPWRSSDAPPEPYVPVRTPVVRLSPSWVHIFPEAFVAQIQEPFANLMRYFHWGVARLVLEPTVAPIVVPIFAHGFEKIAPELAAEDIIERYLPANMGAEVVLKIGDPIPDEEIEQMRAQWRQECNRGVDRAAPNDLSARLREGGGVQTLRSGVMARLRESVAGVRESLGFSPEDPRFALPTFWKRYTESEGALDPDIQFVGKNWAIRRLQRYLDEEQELLPTKR